MVSRRLGWGFVRLRTLLVTGLQRARAHQDLWSDSR